MELGRRPARSAGDPQKRLEDSEQQQLENMKLLDEGMEQEEGWAEQVMMSADFFDASFDEQAPLDSAALDPLTQAGLERLIEDVQ